MNENQPQPRPRTLFGCLKSLFGILFLAFVLIVVALLLLGTLVPKYPKLASVTGAAGRLPLDSDTVRIAGLECLECHNALSDEATVILSAAFSHEAHRAAGYHCQVCHDVAEHTYTAETATALCKMCHAPEMTSGDTCAYCHEYRDAYQPADHTASDWLQVHGARGTSAIPSHDAQLSCAACHDEAFCQKCHALPMPHPPGFATSHASMDIRWGSSCGMCHEESYCDACHGSTEPASHSPKPFKHWDPAVLQGSKCNVCHSGSSYCNDCHTSVKPDSHTTGWDHGAEALAIGSNCGFCHQQSYCSDCHGLDMPHGEGFVAGHGQRSDLGLCSNCHQRSQCLDCHQSVYPKDHRSSDWLAKHVDGDSDRCQYCHAEPVCSDCHGGFEMPHPVELLLDHGEPAYESAKSCALCHDDREDCLQCHRALTPSDHTDIFMMDHGRRATGRLDYCYLCHSSESLCGACHQDY